MVSVPPDVTVKVPDPGAFAMVIGPSDVTVKVPPSVVLPSVTVALEPVPPVGVRATFSGLCALPVQSFRDLSIGIWLAD